MLKGFHKIVFVAVILIFDRLSLYYHLQLILE